MCVEITEADIKGQTNAPMHTFRTPSAPMDD